MLFWSILILLFAAGNAGAQTFTYTTSEASEVRRGDSLFLHGFPGTTADTMDTLKVWCNEWGGRIKANATTWSSWRDSFLFKSLNTFVKFSVDDHFRLTDYGPAGYTYRLTYDIYGYSDLTDTIGSVDQFSDTLTISFNNFPDNTPYQSLNLKRYSGYYKVVIVLTGLYTESGGVISPATLSDTALQNFKVEGSILSQRYDLTPYGIGVTDPFALSPPVSAGDYLSLHWLFGNDSTKTPVNYELEWTYADDYTVNPTTGAVSAILPSANVKYNFRNNSTRVWLNDNRYNIPLAYQHGFVVYRVRAVRPDSVYFKYPVYSPWTVPTDSGTIGSLSYTSNSYHIVDNSFTGDSLNWQYTISFAEGGKYKHVASFFDGLLKNRQSITRFNSNLNQLIATDNVYDFEGRLCIKTLPAPINTSLFQYQHSVDLNLVTGIPYQALDFDTGFAICPNNLVIPRMDSNQALASIYYSSHNPNTSVSFPLYNRYIPDAEGYPLVQTVFEPGYADRVAEQGGAGPGLQIGTQNTIKNAYVGPMQKPLNAIFGKNIGWSTFYTMTVSQDPNQQLSMSVKDYHGNQMASAMIGAGNTVGHALTSINVPNAIFYKQDLLLPSVPAQEVDSAAGTIVADKDFFNEAAGVDSLQYIYAFTPFQACSDQYLSVKGHYNYYITDQCGNLQLNQSGVLGVNGVRTTDSVVNYNSGMAPMGAQAEKYHVHKTLSFYPSDVQASLDSFFDGADCFLSEPSFIRQSVDTAVFPCTGTDNMDSTPCSKLKWEMMQQLFPGAIYGQYSDTTGHVVGTGNSIFSLNCPPDTFHLKRYFTDSIVTRCYHGLFVYLMNNYGDGWPDTLKYWTSNGGLKHYNTDTSYVWLQVDDTCTSQDTISATLQITVSFSGNMDSIYGQILSFYWGDINGEISFTTNSDSFGVESGSIFPNGYITRLWTPPYWEPWLHTWLYLDSISLPCLITHDSLIVHYSGVLPSSKFFKLDLNANISDYTSTTYFTDSLIYDSTVSGYPAGTCGYSPGMKYRYQDTCNVALQDTITVGGIFYQGLATTMPADSFIMIYNEAIAEQNYALALELLPLHPQYCELQHCYNDSFKTEVLAIPNRLVAQSLGLFLLDSIAAHDPVKDSILAVWPYSNPADSLTTFEGGLIKLDTYLIMNAYCGCNDSFMFAQCDSGMFAYQIQHRQLINDAVKDFYFNNIYGLYFMNRRRIMDKLMTRDGVACSHCSLARMSPDPAATIPPAPLGYADTTLTYDSVSTIGSIGWVSHMGSYSNTALYDSVAIAYHAEDSALTYGKIDTIMAHLANCIAGNPTLATNIRNALIADFNTGTASLGNITSAQIASAITAGGGSLNDLCNPFIIDCSQFGAQSPAPANDCLPDLYYADLSAFINMDTIKSALTNTGMSYTFFLDTIGNTFEKSIGRAVGNKKMVNVTASYNAVRNLYQLTISYSGSSPAVNVFLHAHGCGTLPATFTISAACINTSVAQSTATGLINQYSFIANLAFSGGGTCTMLGWVDSIPTMNYSTNALSQCIPCTQLRSLYNQFKDTLQVYGVKGADHPFYDDMLANFMNARMTQTYTGADYETFIQSCALADSLLLPLYAGYATFRFSTVAQMNGFIDTLNNIDTLYSFNNAYRDSTVDRGIISVSVDLSHIPDYELWKYRAKLKGYPSGLYLSDTVDAPYAATRPAGTIGFIYTSTGFNPNTAMIIDTTLVRFAGPYQKKVWIGGQFVLQAFYDVVAHNGVPPFVVSQDIYNINAYLLNHVISGTVFTPLYQSTINADYFKPEKQAYLRYTYGYQSLPSYQVIDSVQTQYISAIYAGYFPGYSVGSAPGLFTNLYLSTSGMNSRLYDTLQAIINWADPLGAGNIFHTANTTSICTGYPELTAYICSDGSYWYRYFTTKDTLYNVYLSFPDYIPTSMRHLYHVASPVIPTPGDSLNRSFTVNVMRSGTTDTLQLTGRTDFVIGRSIELDNVLMGLSQTGVNLSGADTFDNCERQSLLSAVREGIVGYNSYISHLKDSIGGAFRSYLTTAVSEHLLLGYLNDEFNYTLYNYDRAGNLTFTVPPAGVNFIASGLLDSVDHVRTSNTESLCPSVNYTKQNKYAYNTLNQVNQQLTIDGGKTNFFYDAAGRLIFSQNAKQGTNGYYTYNIYDQQNRIIETGEAQMGCPYFDPVTSCMSVSGSCPYNYFSASVGGCTPPGGYILSPHPHFVQFLDQTPADSIPIYIRGYQRDDVVMTIYDTQAVNLGTIPGLDTQQNLRKRVAAVKYFDTLYAADIADNDYTYATHYSYDIEGNAQTLTQDFPDLAAIRQRYKRIDYDYDIISGKVNMLSYNRGWPDQFYQKYDYDADNRITEVHTSSDVFIWKRDAQYAYYDHGPLARVQLGGLNVQGIDYAYTIQGWLKAVNTDTLNRTMDMGQDASAGSVVSRDAVAYTIDYFTSDYKPITGAAVQHVSPTNLSLYNGNIARQTAAIDTFQRLNKQYIYDQLNRIHSANYASINPVTGTLTGLTDFNSHYSYDADGNLQSLVRYAGNTGSGAPLMDSLLYQYAWPYNNQLSQVYDYAPYYSPHDIDTFTNPAAPPRYRYDEIGNTTSDLVSGQDTVDWNLYNKVVRTVRNSDTSSLEFTYDGAGNRVSKSFVKTTPDSIIYRTDYYVHDAQGNILAIYHENKTTSNDDDPIVYQGAYSLAEQTIYGSSRLGTKEYYNGQVGITFSEHTGCLDTERLWPGVPWYSLEYQDMIKPGMTNLYGNAYTDQIYARFALGQKQYELTDHLGDVLATISDKRATDSLSGSHTSGSVDTINSWKPVLVTATDYYPFGMQMPGRYWCDNNTYCYNATITEPVDYFFNQYYDFISLAYSYPLAYFGFTGSGTASYATSLSGDLVVTTGTHAGDGVTMTVDSLTPGVAQTITVISDGCDVPFQIQINSGGTYTYGTISTAGTISVSFTPTTSTVTFNIVLPNSYGGHGHYHIYLKGIYLPRYKSSELEDVVTSVCNEDRYHYGFNGQIKDNEWAGLGNYYQFKTRGFDSRTCRFISVDPLFKKYPWNATYNFAEDRVIDGKDLEGKEYFPGNPGADLLFGWVFRFLNGASATEQGVIQYGKAEYAQQVGRTAVTSHMPDGPSLNVRTNLQKMDGVSKMASGVVQMEVASAEGVMTMASAGDVAGLAVIELLPEAEIGFGIIQSVESKAIGFGRENEKGILDEGVDLHLKMKPEWDAAQREAATAKAQALSDAETYVVKKPERMGNTRGRFQSAGGNVAKGQDVDHKVDLQLGGADKVWNMHGLDMSVNRSMGRQIQHQIKNLPAGAKINKITIK